MTDGLYVSGVWVAEVQPSLNYQGNDLTKPDARKASYSNSFQLPDSQLIRQLTENAEQVDAGGAMPYQVLPARLVDEGETIFTGVAEFTAFQGGWKVNLLDSVVNLFDKLNAKKITDLDLARYNHAWTVDGINQQAGNTEGVVYPVVDYGALEGGVFPFDTLLPAPYAHTLIRQMLAEVGYRPVGTWLDDSLVKRIVVPFVEDEPKSRDQQWVEDRSARVTVATNGPNYYWNYPRFLLPTNRNNVQAKELNILLPLTVDNLLPEWLDGKAGNFKPDNNAYVADVAMRLNVQAYQRLKVAVNYGAMEAMLIAEVNGIEQDKAYLSLEGPHNLSRAGVDILRLDTFVTLRPGDQVTVRLRIRQRTTFINFDYQASIDQESSWASFIPDDAVKMDDEWPIGRNLPDMTGGELLRTVALMTCSTYDVDDLRRTVRLNLFDQVWENIPQARDWSTRIEESVEPELSARLEPYGQRNLLKWKPLDDKALAGYGDGVIVSPVSNAPAETTLFELPFAACSVSEKDVAGYGKPVYIQTRTVSGSGASVRIEKRSTTPRLLLVEPSKTITVPTLTVDLDGNVKPATVQLTAAWWGPRPGGAETPDNAFSLAFDLVAGQRAEQTMIKRYFQTLARVLQRPRALSPSVRLSTIDVADLDLLYPIRLRNVRCGSLQLVDGFYYLNKVNNYRTSTTCIVTLIPLL